MQIRLKIPSISCQSCIRRIENTLKEIKGIQNFKVELSTKSANIEGDFNKNELFEKLKEIGYTPEEVDS